MPAKNIVLLSDGTGNSAAKIFKTNVWRLYEALDLSDHTQIAGYDNGVGTSAFKPLALLGGAFGWGLKRNVRDLYVFLCRNYVPGDRIYAFGFSRGAFTIRVLTGLIAVAGVIDGRNRSTGELTRLAAWAYRSYRQRYNPTGGLVRPLRSIRNMLLSAWDRLLGRESYKSTTANVERPRIEFLGLWDTVAAYGLPIDEMTRGWDQWVWPLSLPNQTPASIVEKACHALALDDERHTFHPLLWDESGEGVNATSRHLDEERISQVWFAGMHSNVGGGYPDDAIAHESLRWLGEEAARRGLRFSPQLLQGYPIPAAWVAQASALGPLSDSRRGLGGLYRYNPRHMARLTQDSYREVRVARPKLHESVVERLRAATDGYEPIVLSERYAVVDRTGAIHDGPAHPLETPSQALSRVRAQERAWNFVWARRIVYFTTVLALAVMILRPFVGVDGRVGLANGNFPLLAALLNSAGAMLPGVAAPWVAYYSAYPMHLVAWAVILGALLAVSANLRGRVTESMRVVWRPTVSAPPGPVVPGPVPTDVVFRIRTHPVYQGVFRFATRVLFPNVFGVVMLAALLYGLAATVAHLSFGLASVSGFVCRDTAPLDPPGGPWTVRFPNNSLCHATGIPLERGARYKVEMGLPPRISSDPPDGQYVEGRAAGVWMDRQHEVRGLPGIPASTSWGFRLGLPLRRSLAVGWFVPIVRVGSTGGQYHALTQREVEFTARESGQLFAYVNDAILPCPGWDCLYRNNTGGPATVTVTKLTPGGSR